MGVLDEIEPRHRCRVDALGDLAGRFVALDVDEGVGDAVRQIEAARHGRFRSLMHWALRPVMSDFDINGLLGTYRMHLLTTSQWTQLIGARLQQSLLDVGAGSGDVTAALAPLFGQVVTTETSSMMVRRLRARGFACLPIDLGAQPAESGPFDVVTCLNVLDRCVSPRALLEGARDSLVDGGSLVLAVALPYDPFFYQRGRTLDPVDRLEIDDPTWEGGAQQLAAALAELGLEVTSLTRAPYLSSGDDRRALYALDDVIVVARRRGPS